MSEFNIDKYKFSSSPALSLVGDDIIDERGKEIILLSKDLNKKGIVIKDLILKSPSLKIRNKLLNISKYILEDVELFEEFTEAEKINIDSIIRKLKINRNLVEHWQDYIVTYIYLLSNPEYKNVSDYLRIELNDDLDGAKEIKDMNDIKEAIDDTEEVNYQIVNTNSGIAVARNNKAAIILTSQGEFKRIAIGEKCKLGEEVSGKEKKNLKKHKFEIIILSMLVLSLISISIYKYVAPSSTLIIDTTSQIQVEINTFNKIISIKSPTEKGKEMINTINVLDTNVDEGLVKVFTYVNENGMIPNERLIITVVGEKVAFGTLSATEEYLRSNHISFQINNNGIEASGSK